MKTKLLISVAATLMLSFHAVSAHADSAAPAVSGGPAAAEKATSSHVDPQAATLMHKVSDFYTGMKSMSMTMNADMHIDSSEGNARDFQSKYKMEYEKPNHFSFVMESGKLGGTAKCDGDKLYLYSPQLSMYMKSQAPSDLSQLFARSEFAFISGGFSGLSLMEGIVAPDPYAVIMQGVTGANIVATETIDGVETQHLHFTQQDLSWDLWVDTGDKPWIRRVTPDVSSILAHYQGPAQNLKMVLKINYADQAINPDVAKSEFTMVPPADAKEVTSFFKGPEAEEKESPLVKKPAPGINLDTLDGGKFDLSAHKDKDVVVLDFWATWCPPCRRALPIIAEVTKSYQAKGVMFYAVDEMEEGNNVKEYLKAQGLDINVLLDRAGEAGKAYQVKGIPQTVIVGKDGSVQVVHIGFAPNLKERLTGELDAILAGKDPNAEQPKN